MIFVSVTGQRDNVGDSLLRRPLLRAAQVLGPCHVLVGAEAADYSTNLGIRSEDVVYKNRRAWFLALTRSALTRRTTLFLNAGENTIDRKFLVGRVALLPLMALMRARGGHLVQLGIGVRHPDRPVPRVLRMLVAMGSLVSWRDEASRAAMGHGTVTPDWAFAEGASLRELELRHRQTEKVLALSLRGDREEPSRGWLAEVKRVSGRLQARLIVVCQVRRDRERAAWLAGELGAELLDWPDGADHATQEQRIRECYSLATWIATDRLHSAIVAITEGAVPLDLVPDSAQKVSRTLASADLMLFPAEGAEARLRSEREMTRDAIARSRARLARAGEAVAGLAGRTTRRDGAPLRVMHSMAGPDRTTKYARHMAATEDFDVTPKFFSWVAALLGRYDVFHVHWPEHLIPGGRGARSTARRVLARVLIQRLRRRRVPVVRTLHNVVPHSGAVDRASSRLHRDLNALTAAEIHLVPGDDPVSTGQVALIPHGSYREPYALFPARKRLDGRILYFGMIKAYKGIPELVAAAQGGALGSLRLVGAPSDPTLVKLIENAALEDPRLSFEFGFVPDEKLASEIFSAAVCVFPYRQLHSSGAVLVALSLGRPVLVPRTPSTIALQQEVGSEWVRIYDELDADEIDSAVRWAGTPRRATRPTFVGRSWADVRAAHREVYLRTTDR